MKIQPSARPYPPPTFFFFLFSLSLPFFLASHRLQERSSSGKNANSRDRERGGEERFQVGNERRTKHGGKDTRLIYLHRFIATEQIISAGGVTSAVNHHLIGLHRESITLTIPPPFLSAVRAGMR